MLDLHVKAGHQWLPSGAGRPSLGRPACPCHHVALPFCGTAPISSKHRFFRRFLQPSLIWAGRPASGGLSVLCCIDTLLSSHGSLLNWVFAEYLTMAQVGLSFGYESKPSGSKLCISYHSLLEWLGFSLLVTLVKSHAKVPPKVRWSAGFGPSGPNGVCFG